MDEALNSTTNGKRSYWTKISYIRFIGFSLLAIRSSCCRAFVTALAAMLLSSEIALCIALVLLSIGTFARRGNNPHFINSGNTISNICKIRQFEPSARACSSLPKPISPTKSRVRSTWRVERSTVLSCAAAASIRPIYCYTQGCIDQFSMDR